MQVNISKQIYQSLCPLWWTDVSVFNTLWSETSFFRQRSHFYNSNGRRVFGLFLSKRAPSLSLHFFFLIPVWGVLAQSWGMGRGNGELFDGPGLLARNIQATAAPFPQQHLSAWRGAVDMRLCQCLHVWGAWCSQTFGNMNTLTL